MSWLGDLAVAPPSYVSSFFSGLGNEWRFLNWGGGGQAADLFHRL